MSYFWTGYYGGQAWSGVFRGSSLDDSIEIAELNKEINELEDDNARLRERARELADACYHRSAVLFAREEQIRYLLAFLEGQIAISPIGIEMDAVYPVLNEMNSESLEKMYAAINQLRRLKRRGGGKDNHLPSSPLNNTPLERKDFTL